MKDVTDETWEELRRLWAHPKVVAVGETGLDYHYEHSPPETQRTHLRRFIREAQRAASAGRHPLPRRLRGPALAIAAEEEARAVGGVIHCFTGGPREAAACLELGFHLSFSGIVTFANAGALRDAVKVTPLDRILIETDAPFLAPLPHRGRRNEPALVRRVAEEVARVLERDVGEIAPGHLGEHRTAVPPRATLDVGRSPHPARAGARRRARGGPERSSPSAADAQGMRGGYPGVP